MASRYCEVALVVPLRHTFTYAIPEALAEVVTSSSRVVSPGYRIPCRAVRKFTAQNSQRETRRRY